MTPTMFPLALFRDACCSVKDTRLLSGFRSHAVSLDPIVWKLSSHFLSTSTFGGAISELTLKQAIVELSSSSRACSFRAHSRLYFFGKHSIQTERWLQSVFQPLLCDPLILLLTYPRNFQSLQIKSARKSERTGNNLSKNL